MLINFFLKRINKLIFTVFYLHFSCVPVSCSENYLTTPSNSSLKRKERDCASEEKEDKSLDDDEYDALDLEEKIEITPLNEARALKKICDFSEWQSPKLDLTTPICLNIKRLSSCIYQDNKTNEVCALEDEKDESPFSQVIKLMGLITGNKCGASGEGASNPLLLYLDLIVEQHSTNTLEYLKGDVFPWEENTEEIKIFVSSGSNVSLTEELEKKYYEFYGYLRNSLKKHLNKNFPPIKFEKCEGHTETGIAKRLSANVLKAAINKRLAESRNRDEDTSSSTEKRVRLDISEKNSVSFSSVKAVILKLISGREICKGHYQSRRFSYEMSCYKVLREKREELRNDNQFKDILIIPVFSYLNGDNCISSSDKYDIREINNNNVIICYKLKESNDTTTLLFNLVDSCMKGGDLIHDKLLPYKSELEKKHKEKIDQEYNYFLEEQIRILSSKSKRASSDYATIPEHMWEKLVQEAKKFGRWEILEREEHDLFRYLNLLKKQGNVHAAYIKAKIFFRAFKNEEHIYFKNRKGKKALEEFESILKMFQDSDEPHQEEGQDLSVCKDVWDPKNESWKDFVGKYKKNITFDINLEWYKEHISKHIERIRK